MKRLAVIIGIAVLANSGFASVVASNERETEVAMVRGRPVSVEISAAPEPQDKKAAADLFWRRAAASIIADEIERREIQVDPEAIELRAQELADQRLDQLGGNEAERQQQYDGVQNLTHHISKALSIWKTDPAAGDAYAREHLEPIGVSASRWEWFKEHHDDPSVAEAIDAGRDYGDDSIIAESRMQAKRDLKQDALVTDISAGRSIPNGVAQRFSTLIANADEIQLLVRSATVYDSGLLRPENQRPAALEGRYVEQRLLGPWDVDDPLPDWALRAMAEAALSLDSVKKDATSRPISLFEGGTLLVRQYQVRINPDEESSEVRLPPEKRSILDRVWGAATFGNWLLNALREGVEVKREYEWMLGDL